MFDSSWILKLIDFKCAQDHARYNPQLSLVHSHDDKNFSGNEFKYKPPELLKQLVNLHDPGAVFQEILNNGMDDKDM